MSVEAYQRCVVIGAGSWGTALATVLADNGCQVDLWDKDVAHVEAMQSSGENQRYLPGFPLPDNITPVHDLPSALDAADLTLVAVPSCAFEAVLSAYPKHRALLWATKGLDAASGRFLHEVADQYLDSSVPRGIITGPSFAKEVMQRQPSAVVTASDDSAFAGRIAKTFANKLFRVYQGDDVLGAEIGGAVKNVLAVAVGVACGLGYGANTRAALMTRGLAEMMRFGLALGAKAETLSGLGGVGDLILTCSDDLSRNRRFGKFLGQGQDAAAAEASIGQVVEGKVTTKTVYELATQHEIRMPITHGVYRLLYEGAVVSDVVDELLS